jgi:hypothetical protein
MRLHHHDDDHHDHGDAPGNGRFKRINKGNKKKKAERVS